MQHLFLNYELSKKAKELGFKEPCLAWFDPFDNKLHTWRVSDTLVKFTDIPDSILSPLYQQILDWFEIEKSYIIDTFFNTHSNWKWQYYILKNKKLISNEKQFETRWVAYDKAIEKVFELIENKEK